MPKDWKLEAAPNRSRFVGSKLPEEGKAKSQSSPKWRVKGDNFRVADDPPKIHLPVIRLPRRMIATFADDCMYSREETL
jgi:hypothetical protein